MGIINGINGNYHNDYIHYKFMQKPRAHVRFTATLKAERAESDTLGVVHDHGARCMFGLV